MDGDHRKVPAPNSVTQLVNDNGTCYILPDALPNAIVAAKLLQTRGTSMPNCSKCHVDFGKTRMVVLVVGVLLLIAQPVQSDPNKTPYGVVTTIPLPLSSGAFAYSPDERMLVIAEIGKVSLLEVASRKIRRQWEIPQTNIHTVLFPPDGCHVLTSGHYDQTIKIWNVRTGKRKGQLPGHKEHAYRLALSKDGKILASNNLSPEGVIKLWDLATFKLLATLNPKKSMSIPDFTFAPDGQTLVVCGGSAASPGEFGVVELWNVKERSIRHTIKDLPHYAKSIAISPDGKTLAIAVHLGPIHFYDMATGKRIGAWKHQIAGIKTMAYSPDGTFFATGGHKINRAQPTRSLGEVWLWEAKTGKILRKLHLPGCVFKVAFSPSGNTLAIGGAYNRLFLLDLSKVSAGHR